MYLKSTCRKSGQRLMFINTPSDSKWILERTLSIWKHLGRCCISVLGFRANLLLSYRLKRSSWSFLGFLDIVLRLRHLLIRSRQEMHISQQGGSSTDEGSGSKPGVPDVPSDDLEEEIS
uniref:Uncharacterized protein n=1 Tax=Tanacetum cinerariifolium TaxID=118510 RepID=A0A699R827_TANCI|nr:hypothetical protein [Tanacetum cinerariifolium]